MRVTETINTKWLKSLKDRIQPQWKPSEEQMKGIDCAIRTLRHQLNVGIKDLIHSMKT